MSVSITSDIRAILWPLRSDHPEFVFTYLAVRTRSGRVRGHRYPITYSGAKIAWRRLRKKAGVVGFRFHDFRHDLGTKLLRETGNLKLVQRALDHADLKTTLRYAHVLDSEVAAARETVAASRNRSRSKGARLLKLLKGILMRSSVSLSGGLGVANSNLAAPTKSLSPLLKPIDGYAQACIPFVAETSTTTLWRSRAADHWAFRPIFAAV